MSDASKPKPLRKRARLPKINEAEEAIVVCQGAISRAPDDAARAVSERSQRIWQRQLAALQPPATLTVLCIRTRVIGVGNSFEILVPLAEINPEGQTYRIIRDNREFVPFHLGIEPYISEIVCMPPGFERYEKYKAHENTSKAKELLILQHAFPESHSDETPFLWDRSYLADKEVTLHVDRQGDLIKPVTRCFTPPHCPSP
jgi:hypothetical protein